jgi:hypothetical protein
MTAHHAHASAAPSAVVVPLVPRPGAGSTVAEASSESFVTELTIAVGHLEKALELGRTPARFLLPTGATVTEAQLSVWVTQHTAQAQNLLDQITAPYTDPQT